MILDIILAVIKAVVGILLIFVIPGYVIDRYFIKSHTLLEKITLSITLSIVITIAVGLLLGWLHLFNYWNTLACFVIIIVVLLIIARLKKGIILKKHSK